MKNQKLIKAKQVRKIIEVVVEESETVLMEKIKRARGKDKEVVRVVRCYIPNSETCPTSIQYQIPMIIWLYLCLKLCQQFGTL